MNHCCLSNCSISLRRLLVQLAENLSLSPSKCFLDMQTLCIEPLFSCGSGRDVYKRLYSHFPQSRFLTGHSLRNSTFTLTFASYAKVWKRCDVFIYKTNVATLVYFWCFSTKYLWFMVVGPEREGTVFFLVIFSSTVLSNFFALHVFWITWHFGKISRENIQQTWRMQHIGVTWRGVELAGCQTKHYKST